MSRAPHNKADRSELLPLMTRCLLFSELKAAQIDSVLEHTRVVDLREGETLFEQQQPAREFFLLERYYLFAHDAKRDRLFRGQVAHPPYQFAATSAVEIDSGPLPAAGFDAPATPPSHQAASPGVHVDILPLARL